MNLENVGGVYRGDIFFVYKANSYGAEQQGGRPAVVVSNDTGNKFSECVEVVYLTTKDKKPLPTHCEVVAMEKSTALCEQVFTVSKDRLAEYIRSCTDEEMAEIDRALAVSLGLDTALKEGKAETTEHVEPANEKQAAPEEDKIRLETERDLYKQMYENLLNRLTIAK